MTRICFDDENHDGEKVDDEEKLGERRALVAHFDREVLLAQLQKLLRYQSHDQCHQFYSVVFSACSIAI